MSYTVPGTWYLLRRRGWSCQLGARRAVERDDGAIEVWKKETWPQVREPRRPAAWIVFEDEAGQSLRPPRSRTWGRRGITPVIRVRVYGADGGSVCSITKWRVRNSK